MHRFHTRPLCSGVGRAALLRSHPAGTLRAATAPAAAAAARPLAALRRWHSTIPGAASSHEFGAQPPHTLGNTGESVSDEANAPPQPEAYDPAHYAAETRERVAAVAAASTSASATSAADSSSIPHFIPSSNSRSIFLSDCSRVLLGLSLVLRQAAALSHDAATEGVSVFVQQNEKNWPSAGEVKEIVQERCAVTGKSTAQPTEGTVGEPAAPSSGPSASSATASTSAPSFDPSHLFSALPSAASAALPAVQSLAAQGEVVAQTLAAQVEAATRRLNDAAGGVLPTAAIDGLVDAQKQVSKQVSRVGQQIGILPPSDGESFQHTADKNSNDALYRQEHVRTSSQVSAGASGAPRDWADKTPNVVESSNRLVSDIAGGVQSSQQAVTNAVNSAAASVTHTAAAVANGAAAGVASAAASAATTAAKSMPASSFNTFSDFQPRERTVPSSPLARIAGFSQIASSIIFGTIKDKVTGVFTGPGASAAQQQQAVTNDGASAADATTAASGERAASNMMGGATGSSSAGASQTSASGSVPPPRPVPLLNSFMSEANTERLAEGLCRMRGAALKVGQMLSIQDESLVPPQLQAVLDRVRDGADVMPRKQLERALSSELGEDWESRLAFFDWKPLAAASIGQVHLARLKDGREVVMKVQYPGVAESINSDVNNLKRLIRFVNVLPKGMYIDETMRAAKEELALECDYSNEALAQKKFKKLVANDPDFHVPAVIDEFSTKRILTTERIYGVAIDRLSSQPQPPPQTQPAPAQEGAARQADKIFVSDATRNSICQSLMRLVLNELFVYRFMQTDPNWRSAFEPREFEPRVLLAGGDLMCCLDFLPGCSLLSAIFCTIQTRTCCI